MNRIREVAEAVKATLPDVVRAVDAAAATLRSQRTYHLYGRGHQWSTGVLDASECPPTFGVPYGLVVGLIAGEFGRVAESGRRRGEDSQQAGEGDLVALKSARTGSGRGARGVGSYTLCDWRPALCATVRLYHCCRLPVIQIHA